ncbi:hypothetical protein I601_0689 [Nocardioides dokdonensis FR1436]|uniref:DUF4243 domain-containing protein n=1 Tax=Nocardioides dokdonensis FR1436 TaxID=1300347 RepID=A0A1A9GFN1_9ACTN|nr:questin oxidase family protein [Nocardioides dokdonensis]ANH37139.1 hypothetical protein I601_0689 [Nocardioides dokdonensis FR1436]
MITTGSYDEALERFHHTGPEREGWLSNHGPMVAEALARLGHEDRVHRWTDGYIRGLEDVPRGIDRIDAAAWRDPLGDPVRSGDWIDFFRAEVEQEAWATTLVRWWPRLLPGIAAGATHGVIRVGHAVRALRAEETAPRRQELAHALAYWAARWQPVPQVAPAGRLSAARALTLVPPVPRQEHGIRNRIAQLDETGGWRRAVRSLAPPDRSADVPEALRSLVDAVLAQYAARAHGNATMLVHAATAPQAVLNALPSLPEAMWSASLEAAWSATAAVVAAYLPPDTRPVPRLGAHTPDEVLEQALAHGGEHVIKLADTALGARTSSEEPLALAAVLTAIDLDA